MDANPGPVDGSVLYDQDKHVSSAVWDGQERGALRCHEHTSKLGEWKLTAQQIELVDKAGFGYLRRIPAISLDNPLISALVERWRRETNTFHLTIGEMTVTLQDVALLLGLSIDGKPVIGITHTTCTSVCQRLLGKSPDSNYSSGGMVKLSWLKEFFSHCPEDAPIEEVERCTRAYLLYLVGSTIFSTTTGNKVPVMYLPLFDNFEESGKFAWGAAALAFLYRALGNACVKSQSTICGCLTLLQCWSYFHLNIGRPKLNREPIHDRFPFVLRWKGKQSGPTTNRDVVFYRKALDSLKPSDVEWLPYKYMDGTVIPEDLKSTLILGRSKTMLICFDKAERHLPDRCLRQFGMFQPIPEEVPRWVRKSRGVDGGVDLSGKMESELNEWHDRRLHIVDGDDGVHTAEYIQWYLKITRKVVGRPISLSSEFQRTISGLREIAYLADSFSTKGLDGEQFESISRIRFIAQDCLRDQAVSPVTPSAIPHSELGKRSRGKERIRRKGMGKRRRKDDPTEYHESSEDDRSQFYGAVIEADQLHLRRADVEVGRLQLCQVDGEADPEELSRTAVEGDTVDLHDVVSKVDYVKISEATNELNDTCYHEAADKLDDSHCHATDEVKGLQVCDATMEEVDESPVIEVNDSHLCRATTHEVLEIKSHAATDQANSPQGKANHVSQLSSATNEVKDLHLPVATETVNDLKSSNYSKGAIDSQLLDLTKDMNDSQLKEGDELHLHDATKQANGSRLGDVIKEADDAQCAGVTKEENGSRLSGSANEVNEVQLPGATEQENGLQFQDATKQKTRSQLPDATDMKSDLQPCSVSKEVTDSQFSDTNKETNDSQIHHTTKESNDLQSAYTENASRSSFVTAKNTEMQQDKP